MTESKWEERKKKKRESPLRRKGRRMSRLCRLRAVGGGAWTFTASAATDG